MQAKEVEITMLHSTHQQAIQLEQDAKQDQEERHKLHIQNIHQQNKLANTVAIQKEMNALHVQYNGIVADIKTQLKQTEQDASSSEASRLVLEEEYVKLKNLITPQTETMEDLADELRRALERERNVQKELNVYKHQAMGVDVRLHDLEYSSLSRGSQGSHGSHGSGRSFKEERERERERERILKVDHHVQHHHPKVHVSRRGSITVTE